MIARVLSSAEMSRLPEGSGLPKLLAYVPANDAQVVVVEDAGRIVACWGVLRITHLEGAWIDPAYRGNAGVVRRLLRKTREIASQLASGWVMSGASDGDEYVRRLLVKLGGVRIPMQTYGLPMRKEPNAAIHVCASAGEQVGV